MSKRKGQFNYPQSEKQASKPSNSATIAPTYTYYKWLPGLIAALVTFIVLHLLLMFCTSGFS